MPYQDERARRKADAERVLANHKMVPEVSRSFYFKSEDPKQGTAYAFSLTWRPGTLVLAGDCGELTLTHYHALGDFEGGLSWATHGDFDYLLGKSDKRQEFDRQGTIDFIINQLNEPVIEALNGGTDWMGRRRDGLRQEMQHWRKSVALHDRLFDDACLLYDGLALDVDEPEWFDFDERQEDPRQEHRFERAADWRRRSNEYGSNTPIDQLWDIPEYWFGWVGAWKKLEAGSFYHAALSDRHPDEVMLSKWRREIKNEIDSLCDDEHSAIDLCYELGFSDYYGSRSWSSHHLFQIAVIQYGVRLILAEASPKQSVAA